MDDGMTAAEVVEAFGLQTPPSDILAVYDYALRQRALHPV
jgi:hypothetical protein